MKQSTIKFEIDLDSNNLPDKIVWDATDKPHAGASETKSISIALWDHEHQNTLRIDLWTKEMPVEDMKRFYVDCIGGLSQSVLSATGDEYMSAEMRQLCDRLVAHLKK